MDPYEQGSMMSDLNRLDSAYPGIWPPICADMGGFATELRSRLGPLRFLLGAGAMTPPTGQPAARRGGRLCLLWCHVTTVDV